MRIDRSEFHTADDILKHVIIKCLYILFHIAIILCFFLILPQPVSLRKLFCLPCSSSPGLFPVVIHRNAFDDALLFLSDLLL